MNKAKPSQSLVNAAWKFRNFYSDAQNQPECPVIFSLKQGPAPKTKAH
ncbi:hypothetical protein Z948_2374 [Sulfitobacter donghicola DSW-25 = KCTC 12864 = JCM 14565]|nr:hypothetical protein Z948_2374 [Sulfitobacter donghicola DSW-25 = KCTC 12864 = JCM 14565]